MADAQFPVDQTPLTLTVDAEGAVHAGPFHAPPSIFLSPEGRAQLVARLTAPPMSFAGGLPGIRAAADAMQEKLVAKWLALYPCHIDRRTMNGVPTDVVTPLAGVAAHNAQRVLINLHGGGFFVGAAFGGQAEAIPLAGHGAVKVVAIDYRLAPEHAFPAASEDVEQVYRALLQTYRPENIGIYGCSAGGTLTAQALARFQQLNLPRPGAVGLFCAGALPSFWYGGDSMATTPILNGRLPMAAGALPQSPGDSYFAAVDQNDPLITPGLFSEVLAQFPPTLVVTGSRDISMSNALATHSRLLDAGVDTRLLVQEGLGHGDFNTAVGSPEAAQAYAFAWRFFDDHLGR